MLLFFIFQRKRKKYFRFKNQNNDYFFEENRYFINKFLKLKNKPSYINTNDSIINEERKNFLKFLSKETHKNIEFLDTLFYTPNRRFGNALCNLNKIIFYCEIIRCKKIILDKKIFWFIKNKIIIKKNNITIEVKIKKNIKNLIYYIMTLLKYYFIYIKLNPK